MAKDISKSGQQNIDHLRSSALTANFLGYNAQKPSSLRIVCKD